MYGRLRVCERLKAAALNRLGRRTFHGRSLPRCSEGEAACLCTGPGAWALDRDAFQSRLLAYRQARVLFLSKSRVEDVCDTISPNRKQG